MSSHSFTDAPVTVLSSQRPVVTSLRGLVIITLATLLGTCVVIVARGLSFPLADAIPPVFTCGLLLLAAEYYHRKREEAFVLCLTSLTLLVAFSAAFATLTYCIAVTARPMADQALAAADAAMGLNSGTVVLWVKARPTLDKLLEWAYFSTLPQTALVIVVLGLKNDRRTLQTFLLRFMIGALVAALGFLFWPAMGSCAVFNYDIPGYHMPFAEHFTALRNGAQQVVTWKGAQGLVTFPSFHTVWAIVLAAAFWKYRGWRMLAVVLNVLVVISTVPTGMHYFVDVLAGGILAAVLCVGIRDEGREMRGERRG